MTVSCEVDLLKKLCKLGGKPHEDYLLAKLIEQIYSCRNSKLILPLSFQEALVTYKLSNNAQLSALNSRSRPSGSHTYLTTWLNKASAKEITFPSGLVRVVFDNEQVIGKRYRVKANQSNVPSSVISSSIYLSIDESSEIQNIENLKPSYWMFDDFDDAKIEKLIKSFESHSGVFRQTRDVLIGERLNIIKEEWMNNTVNFDYIDKIIATNEKSEKFRFCKHCKKDEPHSNRKNQKCKTCKKPLTNYMDGFKSVKTPLSPIDPYGHFKGTAKANNIRLLVGEPDMINPNGYENISTIMQNLGQRAKIDGCQTSDNAASERKWLFVAKGWWNLGSHDENDL